jgi:hypothetical protein
VNPFRDSSAGVQLFPFSTLDSASGYTVVHVFGFVEELVVAEDPEFVWDADFRKAKTSHETRQTLMYLLDASVRRRMCKKVLEVSHKCHYFHVRRCLSQRITEYCYGYSWVETPCLVIIRYVMPDHLRGCFIFSLCCLCQNFDAEGDSGLVARTYGTCVLLERQKLAPPSRRSVEESDLESGPSAVFSRGDGSEAHYPGKEPTISGRKNARYKMSEAAAVAAAAAARHRDSPQDEVQLLTLRAFDASVRVRVGGLVTARSVKFLGNLASKLSDQETRDSWWTELRDEVSSFWSPCPPFLRLVS